MSLFQPLFHALNGKDVNAGAEWTWENTRRWQWTIGLKATPEQRLAWLEEMIAFAHARGARKIGFEKRSGEGAAK